jgi:hypothetical protein
VPLQKSLAMLPTWFDCVPYKVHVTEVWTSV